MTQTGTQELEATHPVAAEPSAPSHDGGRAARPGRLLPNSLVGAVVLLGAVHVLAFATSRPPLPVSLLGFAALVAVLGRAVHAALPGPQREPALVAYLSLCYGLVALIVAGLLANTLLPLLDVDHPLSRLPLLATIDMLFVVLAAAGRPSWPHLRPAAAVPSPVAVARLGLVALPLAAAAGAVALDNGRSGGLTVALLVVCLVLLAYWTWRAPRISRATLLTGVYAVALALLLMTSLRGRYITGHDVQHEFFVFQLAREHWHWSIAAFRDPYNACLSITILPTALVSLLHVDDVLVYKLLFQMLFATVPVGVFLVADRVMGPRRAMLAVIVFVSFPTYFSDMPSLNRQEIALTLLVGMTLLLVDRQPGRRWHQQLQFVVLGLGVVLSHYSSSFLMVGQFLVAAGLLAVARLVGSLRDRRATQAVGRHRPFVMRGLGGLRLLTLPVAVLLAAATVVWQSPLTHTGNNARSIGANIVESLTGRQTFDSRSSDLSISLLGGGGPTQQQQLADFSAQALKDRQPGAEYYPASQVAAYPLTPAPEQRAPLTAAGRDLSDVGISPYFVNSALRGGSARLLQALVLLGLAAFLLRPGGWGLRLDAEYRMLCIGGLGVVGGLVVLPFLSVDYGVLRAFQQSLVVLAVPTVLGITILGSVLGRWGRSGLLGALPVAFFASSTGIVAAATGGYLPQLHLSNAGDNYDAYYVQDGEAALATWVLEQQPHTDGVDVPAVEADPKSSSKIMGLYGRVPGSDIVPALVQRNAYVYLSWSNVDQGVATARYEDQDIGYRYPVAFLQQNKNLVATTGSVQVYR